MSVRLLEECLVKIDATIDHLAMPNSVLGFGAA
jgi:hypothetical protein